MNKIKSTIFLAIFIAATATTTLADGQIPIMGRPESEPTKTTTTITVTATEPKNEISFEISNYLSIFVSVIGQFKF